MNDRYARQIALPDIGVTGQARLARVLVVSAGGLELSGAARRLQWHGFDHLAWVTRAGAPS